MKPININFTPFFVVNRKTGASYDIVSQGIYSAKAHSNKTTEGEVRIDLKKLVKGLREKRYRLVPKNLPSKVMYCGVITILNND